MGFLRKIENRSGKRIESIERELPRRTNENQNGISDKNSVKNVLVLAKWDPILSGEFCTSQDFVPNECSSVWIPLACSELNLVFKKLRVGFAVRSGNSDFRHFEGKNAFSCDSKN